MSGGGAGAAPLKVSAEVRAAVDAGRPVVALESTIISHGFPFPENLSLARELEAVVRKGGAVPATIALADGAIHVGGEDALLERLAREPGVEKVSRRNLAAVLARGVLGATTVAATMLCADLAGIRVFATGGLGGVHRGAPQTMDVSADLTELARTPVCVVCAGAKAILDLGLTLEYLETHGVPVLGVGTKVFPAFYTRDSGLPVPTSVASAGEAAHIARAHWAIGGEGLVVAVPIPEGDALPREVVDAAIGAAIDEAEREGVRGSGWTPFVLDQLRRRTGGRTVAANRALVRNNARVAAELAVALSA